MTKLPSAVQAVVRQFVESQTVPADVTILKIKKQSQGCEGVLRMAAAPDGAVVVKIWNRQTFRDRVRRLLGCSNAGREWAVHRSVYHQGLSVPKPVTFGTARCGNGQRVDVMLVQDLQQCHNSLIWFKQLLLAGDEPAIQDFERRLIQLTAAFVQAGMTDVDHQLNNMLVDKNGVVYRIDFECARRHWLPRLRDHDLGQMLGRLICSHVYACQPDMERSQLFAKRLIQCLQPPVKSRTIAKETLDRLLEQQRQKKGVDSSLVLPW